MAYTTIDNPELYFQTKTYTGTGSSLAVTLDGSENLQPDWLWIKNRGASDENVVHDSVRGVGKRLITDGTQAEATTTNQVSSFDSDGFTVPGGSANTGASSNNYVAWNWKAGTSFTNDASSTGVGTIDSTGSASDTSGFSIVSYTGTGSNGTVKHGLSTAPKVVITKGRDSSGKKWCTGHNSLGWTKELFLNTTDASASAPTAWNNTDPTNSVVSLGTGGNGNSSGEKYIMYCLAEKKGYSKFGSYTGNGNADGTFIYTGFKPAWLLIKQSSGAGNDWLMYDTKRDTFNVANKLLIANGSAAEATGQSFNYIDLLSNGFKLRGSDARNNGSGGIMIYMAFAESPFVNSNGVPNNAR